MPASSEIDLLLPGGGAWRPTRTQAALKRTLDLTLGLVLAGLALPVILALALLSMLTLRANPFFVQRRPGLGDTELRMLKLRTLPKSFPVQAVKPELSGSPVPPFGGWLRRNHLDELPQLLEVVLGRMSLVGPRPRLCDAVEPVDPAYDRLRRRVPQGCTGLWQISVASNGAATGVPEFDLFYLRHMSVRLDLWIIVRTMLFLVGLAAPIALDDLPRWVLRRTRTATIYEPDFVADAVAAEPVA